ncbi:MAG: hypothetical protein HW383_816 [Candidatus Magasanikbacteria bacterium]|nr:hypothetical protein [Candidatus Magasanikbacteria bacterium]
MDYFEGLKLIATCPLCDAAYDPVTVRIIEERDDIRVVHVTCQKCMSAVVALIMTTPMGVSSVALMTDCTPEDVDRVRSSESVTLDDALDLHEMLKRPATFVKQLI